MNFGKKRSDAASQPAEPVSPGIAMARGQLAKGDAEGAASTLRQLSRQPDLSLTTRIEAAKLLATAGAQADAIACYLEVGRRAIDAGDVATARSSLSAAHTLDQKNYDALFELGRVDLAEGRKEEALAKFVEVLRKSNLRHLPALYEAAVLYEADGQTDQAILAYKKIAERDRHHVPTLTRLAEMHRKKGQLGEALGYYLQGARAAMQAQRYRDARNLIDNALQIEDDNWEARRLLSEVQKADVEVTKQAEPAAKEFPQRPSVTPQMSRPAQPAAAQASAGARPAPTPQPPPKTAAPPPAATQPAKSAPPPPRPAPAAQIAPESDFDVELPAEATLLEKQSEVTSKLAAITAEVAEAYKKRVVIERDIKAAQAALEALNAQRGTVESSISAFKQQLDSVTQAKAAEDRALAELRSKLEASRADLEKLAALPQFISGVEAKSSAVASLISNATMTLESAQRRATDAQNKAGTVEKTASELIARIGAARQQADDALEQLKGVLEDSKGAKADAGAAAAGVAELKTTLGALQQLKTQVDAAKVELGSLSQAIEAKRAQAAAALSQLDQKRAQRDSQFQATTAQLGGPAPQAAAAARASAPAARPPEKQAKADAGKVDIDSLLLQGRLDDALRAARESTNGTTDAHARMVEAAERLRQNGNAAAAAKACEKLVSAGSTGSAVCYCLARSYVDLKRYKEAVPMFEALAEPEFGVLRESGIGQCLRGLGRADEAAQHFSKALEIPGQPDGQYREVLYNLADLYESRGDQESLNLALWSFEEIQAGAPDYRDVVERIESLKDQLAKIVVPEPNPVLRRDAQGGRDARF